LLPFSPNIFPEVLAAYKNLPFPEAALMTDDFCWTGQTETALLGSTESRH